MLRGAGHLAFGGIRTEASSEDADGLLHIPPDQPVAPAVVVCGDQRGRGHVDHERHLGDDLAALVVGAIDQGVEEAEDHQPGHEPDPTGTVIATSRVLRWRGTKACFARLPLSYQVQNPAAWTGDAEG